MTPPYVTNKVLLNAKLMQAQLLIHTHTPEITQYIQDVYDLIVELHLMRSGDHTLLIQIDLEDPYIDTLSLHLAVLNLPQTSLST